MGKALMFSTGQLSQRIYKSFGILLGLLLLLIGFSFVNFQRMANAERLNQHSYQVLLETYRLVDSLNALDSGVRGFITSGKTVALIEYHQALSAYDQDFARIKALTADRAAHQERLARLDRSKRSYVSGFLEPLIAMRRVTRDDSQAVSQSRKTIVARRAALTKAKAPLLELEIAETQIQQERSQRLHVLQDWTLGTLALGSLFSIGLTSWLVSQAARGSRRLDEANLQLTASQERTEAVNGELLQINARLQTEIFQRRTAEDKLRLSVEELKKSNAELEQFAYVASHDLQEPLRAVGGCVQVLQKRYEGKLDARADQFIQHAVDGAQRMQNLINDLLAYSRVGTKLKSLEWVEGQKILALAQNNVSVAIQESGALITSDELPKLWCDGGQIEQVVQNLLSNAIKFRGEAPPRIHVGCRQEMLLNSEAETEAFWVIAVQDDGPGIEAQYFDRIFVMFQRLHTRTHFPGTGIGLAICKKIIERHHGKLWVESEVGRGSTFQFSLPVEPRPENFASSAPMPEVETNLDALKPMAAPLSADKAALHITSANADSLATQAAN